MDELTGLQRSRSLLVFYPREQREKDLLVQPVKISREYFEELQANAEELFHLETRLASG